MLRNYSIIVIIIIIILLALYLIWLREQYDHYPLPSEPEPISYITGHEGIY